MLYFCSVKTKIAQIGVVINRNNMKKILLVLSLISGVSFAQDCTKLFISEYVEGWSNNKALEIYNPTNAPINLAEYFVARYSNGASAATVNMSVQLSGTIPARGVFVAVLDKRDPAGMGQEAPIWDSLEVRADGFFSPVYATSQCFYWNGDDAIMLAKGTLSANATDDVTSAVGFQIVDIFGKIGEDPGTSWSTVAPYLETSGGTKVTLDHSLIRKSTVKKGVITPVTSFNALAEYDSIPATTYLFDGNGDTIESQAGNPIQFGNWFSLGTHDCECNVLSSGKTTQEELVVYPNPTLDGNVYIKGAQNVKEISVLNALGQVVAKANGNANPTMVIRLGDDRGVYLLRITSNTGETTVKRVVVK